MLSVISKTPLYYSFRKFGWPRRRPINLTLSISYKCNSRCKTCNVYRRHSEDLTLLEWRKIFRNFGHGLFWATISGGEPFLRPDLPDIVANLFEFCRPSIINIPTNGILCERIPEMAREIARRCKSSQVIINVSFDEIEAGHDEIRGVPGGYLKAVKTCSGLKALGLRNLSVGIHTVISRYNASRIPQIYEKLRAFRPDSYVTEIAEERGELENHGSRIAPDEEDYGRAVDWLIEAIKRESFTRVGKIARAFRIQYYRLVKRTLRERRQVIPCYAGFASAQIAPDGDVWMCCIEAESIGSLRDADYDFGRVWFSGKAEAKRKAIVEGRCYCPLANAAYTNMLHHPKTLFRAGWSLLRSTKTSTF